MLDQSFASYMSLLMSTSTFKLERRHFLLIGGVTYTTFVPITVTFKITEIHVVTKTDLLPRSKQIL